MKLGCRCGSVEEEILSKEVDDVRVKYECAVGGRALCGGTVGRRGTQRAFNVILASRLEPVFFVLFSLELAERSNIT